MTAQTYLEDVLNPVLDDLMFEYRRTCPENPLQLMAQFATEKGRKSIQAHPKRRYCLLQFSRYLSEHVHPLIAEFTYQCLKSRPDDPYQEMARFSIEQRNASEYHKSSAIDTFEDVLSMLVNLPKEDFLLLRRRRMVDSVLVPNFLARSLVFVQMVPRPYSWTMVDSFSSEDAARWQILADYPWHNEHGTMLGRVMNKAADDLPLFTAANVRPLCFPLEGELHGQAMAFQGELLDEAMAAPNDVGSWTCEVCDSSNEQTEEEKVMENLSPFCLNCGSHWNPGDDSWEHWKTVWKCSCGTIYGYIYDAGNIRCSTCNIFRPIQNLLNQQAEDEGCTSDALGRAYIGKVSLGDELVALGLEGDD